MVYRQAMDQMHWTNSGADLWPKNWLPSEFRKCTQGNRRHTQEENCPLHTVGECCHLRIVGVRYNSQATSCYPGEYGRAAQGHEKIATSLFHNLVDADVNLGGKPFVLVGHSYGGIIIKSLVNICHDYNLGHGECDHGQQRAAENFMNNFRGFVFYGVPQKGSDLANQASSVNKCLPVVAKSVIEDLRPLRASMVNLGNKFEEAIKDNPAGPDFLKFAFSETKCTKKWGIPRMVVSSKSAKGNLLDSQFLPLQGKDHSTIVKPLTQHDEGYRKIVQLLRRVISNLPRPHPEAGPVEVPDPSPPRPMPAPRNRGASTDELLPLAPVHRSSSPEEVRDERPTTTSASVVREIVDGVDVSNGPEKAVGSEAEPSKTVKPSRGKGKGKATEGGTTARVKRGVKGVGKGVKGVGKGVKKGMKKVGEWNWW